MIGDPLRWAKRSARDTFWVGQASCSAKPGAMAAIRLSHEMVPSPTTEATTVAARDLETEANWKTVSASMAASLPSSRTPNPPAKARASSWTTATAMPGTPDCCSIVAARSGRRSTARAARCGVTIPGASAAGGSPAGGLASCARRGLGGSVAAPRLRAARPAPVRVSALRVSARRRVSGSPNGIGLDSTEDLFMSGHLPFQGIPGGNSVRLRPRHSGRRQSVHGDRNSRLLQSAAMLPEVTAGDRDAQYPTDDAHGRRHAQGRLDQQCPRLDLTWASDDQAVLCRQSEIERRSPLGR